MSANPNPAAAQAFSRPRLNLSVAISPSEATLFAGETQAFVAIAAGGEETLVWSVTEEGGGTVTSQGLYIAPKVQGIYHVTVASASDPQKRAIATVTVLSYCDTPAAIRK